GWIVAHDLFHPAVVPDELAPVVCAEKAETVDAVAHGDLVNGLTLSVGQDELFDGQSLLGQPLRQPTVGEGEMRTLSLKVPGHLREERARESRRGGGHVGHDTAVDD